MYSYIHTDVTCNCLHPGIIDTGIWRNVPFPLSLGMQLIVKTMFKVRSLNTVFREKKGNRDGEYVYTRIVRIGLSGVCVKGGLEGSVR